MKHKNEFPLQFPQPAQPDNTIANLKFILLLHARSTMRVESNLFFMILKFNFDCFSFSVLAKYFPQCSWCVRERLLGASS